MITVTLKRGFGYLGAGMAAKKIRKILHEKGVVADCYSEKGYVKIDIEEVDADKLNQIIAEKIVQRFGAAGVVAQVELRDDGIFIKNIRVEKEILEEKIRTGIGNYVDKHCLIDSIN